SQILCDPQRLGPVSLCEINVQIHIGVAFHGQDSQAKLRIVLDKWMVEHFGKLVRRLLNRQPWEFSAQFSDARVDGVAFVTPLVKQLLSPCKEWLCLRPVPQPREMVCFFQNLERIVLRRTEDNRGGCNKNERQENSRQLDMSGRHCTPPLN